LAAAAGIALSKLYNYGEISGAMESIKKQDWKKNMASSFSAYVRSGIEYVAVFKLTD
jgi:hypothetical protein